ncbi:hypothetical protein CEG18_24630 [Pseudomonas nitroreducens]|uniref:Sulfatase N-terminal domain-containing protein n=1 Tax=Pseudomonas nitroreducens TaxID=46680 RepID=A0A246F4G8_PSENT|nr:hypothetical protein CEG18_24630 [Pseudomonas nitroreducens]
MSRKHIEYGLSLSCRLSAAITLFFAPPLLFLFAYIQFAHAPESALAVHLYVIAWIAVAMAAVRLLISLLPVSAALRQILAAVMISFAFWGLFSLYAGALIGVKFWGRVASVQLISTYVSQTPATLKALDINPYLILGVVASLFILCAVTAYFYLRKYDWIPVFRRLASPALVAVIAFSLLCIFSMHAASFDSLGWERKGEPLSLALFADNAEVGAQSNHMGLMRMNELQRKQDAARDSYVPSINAHKSNIILIVVDALRADHLSLLGYNVRTTPNLERFKSQGSLQMATTAVAVCNESFCGLRGLAASQSVVNQAEHPFTLHETLKKYGYRVELMLSGDHTNFYGLSNMYGKVDGYFDGAAQTKRYVNDDRLLLDHLEEQKEWDGNPVMIQFHLMSAHPLGLRFDETPEFGPGKSYALEHETTPAAVQSAVNYYDRGVLQSDAIIAELLSKLASLGYLDDALVVITGDHGESLGEHGLYTHSQSVWEESLRVPFVVLSFGKAETVSLAPSKDISQIDIAPTLLHALRMKIPEIWQGAALQEPNNRRYIDFQQAQYLGLIDTRADALYKHWIDTRSGQRYTFNLSSKDQEKTDVTGQVAAKLQRQWREHLIQQSAALPLDVKRGCASCWDAPQAD